MKHRLFLLDLDDTLLDFKASERLAFAQVLRHQGVEAQLDTLFAVYQPINLALWRRFEQRTISKEALKVERFRETFAAAGLDLDAAAASEHYLDSLAEAVVLIDGAEALCAELAAVGEIGIITNGVERIQARRIVSAGLMPHISFVATSEASGFAKPDTRFFDYTTARARSFDKVTTLMIGDRLDADILGAQQFGIDSCWFNPQRLAHEGGAVPTFVAHRLEEIVPMLRAAARGD